MEKEIFKMNLINQIKTKPDEVKMLLIPRTSLLRTNTSIYRNSSRYFSKEHELTILLSMNMSDRIDDLCVSFNDINTEEIEKVDTFYDLSHPDLKTRVFYEEDIRFENQKGYFTLKIHHLEVNNGVVTKTTLLSNLSIVYSFIDKKFEKEINVNNLEKTLANLKSPRSNNTYVEFLSTPEMEKKFRREIKFDRLKKNRIIGILELSRNPLTGESPLLSILKVLDGKHV